MKPSDFILAAKASFVRTPPPEVSDLNDDVLELLGITHKKDETQKREYVRKKAIEIAKRLTPEGEYSEEIACDIVKTLETDYCHLLIDKHRSVIPETILELYDLKKVDCGLIENEYPFCQTYSLGENGNAILMSSGLTKIVYSAVRTFCGNIKIGNEESVLTIDDVSSIIADDLFVFKKTLSISPRQGVEISTRQLILANKLSVYCELFFLFHEFAHILLASANVEDLFSKDEEYVADWLAVRMCLGMTKSGGGSKSNLWCLHVCTTIVFFF